MYVGIKSMPASSLNRFKSGGSKLVSSAQLEQHPNSPTIGAPEGTFISTTDDINALLNKGYTRAQIADELGITDPLFLEGDLIRVDITYEAMKNIRNATGGRGWCKLKV